MAKQVAPPRTGVEIIEGRPGSGKSLFAVKRVVRVAILKQRRAVYTNLPLHFRKVRRYLRTRGGEDLARLIRPLSEGHMNAFMDRYVEREEYLRQRKFTYPKERLRDRIAAWYEHAGSDVNHTEYDVDGNLISEGNWIPAGSVIVLDEAHQWYPNPHLKNVYTKKEPESMMKYLTMHRHLAHWPWFITQDRRQISPTVKSQADNIWIVRKLDDYKAAWGLRWSWLGLKVLSYRCYTPEQEETDEPHELYNDIVNLPWQRWWFRLYESFTHAGSAREIKAGIEAVRAESGLDIAGGTNVEHDMKRRRQSWFVRLTWWIFRKAIMATVILLLVAGAFRLGRMGGDGDAKEQVAELSGELEQLNDVSMELQRNALVSSVTAGGVRFRDGVGVAIGGTRAGLQLVGTSPAARSSLWRDGDDAWLWRIGGGAIRIGDFRSALSRIEAADRVDDHAAGIPEAHTAAPGEAGG